MLACSQLRRPLRCCVYAFCFFFTDPATAEIYTLSLHDALPISSRRRRGGGAAGTAPRSTPRRSPSADRKSTRLNSSHQIISYAVFCLKKKNKEARACDRFVASSGDDDRINHHHAKLHHHVCYQW